MAVDTQMTDLYKATLGGQKKEVSKYLNKHNKKIMGERCPLTLLGDTVLHIAAYNNHEDLFVDLLHTSSNDLMSLRRANQLGNTVLHEVATTGSLRMAYAVIDKERELLEQMGMTHVDNSGELLLSQRNNSGETPLFTAAVFGQREMFNYFASKLAPANVNTHLRNYDGTTVLHVAILRESYDMAYKILQSYQHLAVARDGEGLTGLHFLASISTAFPSGSRLGVLRRFIYNCIPSDNIEPEFDSPDEGSEENPNSNLGNPTLPPNYEACMQLLAMAGSGCQRRR